MLGDFVSDGLSLGSGLGSVILGFSLLLWLFLQRQLKLCAAIFYWVTLLLVRAVGTTSGDYLSGTDGLNLGFGPSSALMAVILLLVLSASKKYMEWST
ncbi:MAG: hypothetical protein P4L53_03835 [Candidatus Obscuribacterales bacterium]|nr:hypothetical protein [Candidatus Obscuribacterales bacterium]